MGSGYGAKSWYDDFSWSSVLSFNRLPRGPTHDTGCSCSCGLIQSGSLTASGVGCFEVSEVVPLSIDDGF